MPTLDATACGDLMDELTRIVAHAAETILDLAIKPGVRSKADGSPVTAADEAAEAIICDGLKRLAPDVPVISEEQSAHEKPETDGGRQLLSGRPARRHAGIHRRPRRIYDQYCTHDRWSAAARHHLRAGARRSLARHRRARRRADLIGVPDRAANSDPHPAAARQRSRRHGQPLASRSAHQAMSTACRGQSSSKAARR